MKKSSTSVLALLSLFFLLLAGDASTSAKIKTHKVDKDKVKAWTEKRKLFVAKESQEGVVKFHAEVEINSDRKPSSTKVHNTIDQQLWHLFGPLSEATMYAVPKGDHQVLSVSAPTEKAEGVWVADYAYKGTFQIKKGKEKDFKIILPVNPENIFERARKTSKDNCTDHHYNSEDDFWYFWNPYKGGCDLVKSTESKGGDYVEFTPEKIDWRANTPKSYPDYGRTVDTDGVIRIHFLLGLDEPQDNEKNRNPLESKDTNASTYKQIRRTLINQLGFKVEGDTNWTEEQIKKVAPVEVAHLPFVETLTKEINREIKKGNKKKMIKRIEARLFFGPSGIGEDDNAAFHFFYKDAIEHAAFMLYDGHSGLGGHLDLDSINQSLKENGGSAIRFSKSKYQVYFFNSCTSYTYYNLAYFEAKGGPQNLDILTNGLATSFYVLHETNMALIRAVSNWATGTTPLSTFQSLATIIDSSNLFGVNGDEQGNPLKESENWL